MTIVTSIISWFISSSIGQALGKWVITEFEGELASILAAHRQKVADQDAAALSVKQLQAAKTGDDIAKATPSALDGV